MSKYGLQIRGKPSQQKKQPSKPPLPPPKGFSVDDDDDDIENDISRQASKNKARKEIEEQQKKALEEDPSVFDYDGVYDEMKEQTFHRKVQARADTQPKYINKLIQKAEERQREHDIIYERKLAKERSKEDHLYADKDKFVTSAYKKKLAEQQMWAQQQALRDLRDERDDVTKKTDLSDFYFNLQKNVAFGAGEKDTKNVDKKAEARKSEKEKKQGAADTHGKKRLSMYADSSFESSRVKEGHRVETSAQRRSTQSSDTKPASDGPVSDNLEQEKPSAGNPSAEKPSAENASAEQPSVENPSAEKPSAENPSAGQPKRDHHKRSENALAAAKERFLARKRSKQQ